MSQEIATGDRLVPASGNEPLLTFQPRPGPGGKRAQIIAVLNGVSQIGSLNLVVIDLPVHNEVHAIERELGREEAIAEYKALMRSAGTYYDLSGPSAITADRAEYIDALHTSKDLLDGVIREIWQGPLVNGTADIRLTKR